MSLSIICHRFQLKLEGEEIIADFYAPYFRMDADWLGAILLTNVPCSDKICVLVNGIENEEGSKAIRRFCRSFLPSCQKELSHEPA